MLRGNWELLIEAFEVNLCETWDFFKIDKWDMKVIEFNVFKGRILYRVSKEEENMPGR